MITEDTRIDLERVGDIIPPSVCDVLREVYGPGFDRANTDECLTLVEAIAFSLRVGGAFSDNLYAVLCDGQVMPCGLYTPAEVGRNEGLKLLAVLQVAIVERYSVATVKH